jgi:thymidylate synthase ThyX
MTESGKEIANYADESMFVAETTEDFSPRVTLIHANNDPLGQLAQLGMMYQGKSVRDLAEITDEDRQYYFKDGRKNILGMPSEAIVFHFLIENVTRSYTHQLVRTRHASYAQESLRFAVKEDFPVALPPSLVGTKSLLEEGWDFAHRMGWGAPNQYVPADKLQAAMDQCLKNASTKQRHRFEYDEHNNRTQELYLKWIAEGMPAEDARYVTPHGILTKINMVIPLRSLMAMAGQRLCTQAQFEHRQVWDQLVLAIREYGNGVEYEATTEAHRYRAILNSSWQFDAIADQFLPICYQTGKCQFESDFDRYCNIRDRVQANAKIGRASSEWHRAWYEPVPPKISVDLPMPTTRVEDIAGKVKIRPINPQEWLRPDAAIQPDGLWRSKEAQDNIKGRRL